MSLAILDKVKKYYGDRLILDINKFEIFEGQRIGLVGENGAGKTTLIKALIGEIGVDEGYISLTKSYAYISQKEENIGICKEGKIKSIFNAPKAYQDYLSGGEKVKLRVANALTENKRLIIADEPTSNLDSKSVNILEEMLQSYKGAMLLVSHDREFLDILCNIIIEIEDGKLKFYKGNYTNYIETKRAERERAEVEYNGYMDEKQRLENAILVKQGLRDSIRKAPRRFGNSEARLCKMGDQKAKKNLDGNIKALKSRIEHLEVKDKPKATTDIKIRVKEGLEIISKNPIEVRSLDLIIGEKLLIKEASFKIMRGKKIAILGENGCGKTTLIKAIVNGNNEKIKINNRAIIGYFDQSQSILSYEKSILENIKYDSSYDETFIRINLDGFGFKGDSVLKKVEALSGGEMVKVALCKILLSDNNILILDEPTNYLDIKAMEALEATLINMDKTLVMVTHDRRFINNVCDYIIEVEDNTVRQFNGSYDEYLKDKNKPKIDKNTKVNKERLMVLENKLSELISLLSFENDVKKKEILEAEYKQLLIKVKMLEK